MTNINEFRNTIIDRIKDFQICKDEQSIDDNTARLALTVQELAEQLGQLTHPLKGMGLRLPSGSNGQAHA